MYFSKFFQCDNIRNLDMDFNSGVYGQKIMVLEVCERQLIFLKAVPSKLILSTSFSHLLTKVQQTFFVPAKKKNTIK